MGAYRLAVAAAGSTAAPTAAAGEAAAARTVVARAVGAGNATAATAAAHAETAGGTADAAPATAPGRARRGVAGRGSVRRIDTRYPGIRKCGLDLVGQIRIGYDGYAEHRSDCGKLVLDDGLLSISCTGKLRVQALR